MRNFLTAFQIITLTSTTTIGSLVSSEMQNHKATTLSQATNLTKINPLTVNQPIEPVQINWKNVEQYQSMILKKLPQNALLSLNQNQTTNANNYQQIPFSGVNKVELGFFVTTVYMSENLLNFLMQEVIKYHHGQVEIETETIVAVLLAIGFRTGALVLGAIASILYSYIEVLASVDEGAGVGFYLLVNLVLSGVWAQ